MSGIKSQKQLRKLADLANEGKLDRNVFNSMIDDTEDITALPEYNNKQLTKKGK